MLRVIFVTGSLAHGGAERHAVTVMNRLAARGHECHAIYIKDDRPHLADRICLRDGGSLRCLGATRYFDRRALSALAADFAGIRPTAIVAANAYALMYASLALRLSRVRAALAVTYHSTRLLGAKERLQMAVYRGFFWTADCLVFVCETQKRYWVRRGVLSRRIEVIHNGVDTDAFCDRRGSAERGIVRRALGYSESDYVVGMSALLRPEKNHVQLVDAIACLRNRGIPAKALMIGDGEMRGAIEARARALGVERHLRITGVRQDVRPCLAACDVVALCSLTETFSLAAIEAMALRRPVVHADVGGAAEMIVPGQNGFLFPVGDTDALVDRLSILADRAVRGRMGDHARAAVESRFSEKTMVDRYERLLLELCGTRAGVRDAVAA